MRRSILRLVSFFLLVMIFLLGILFIAVEIPETWSILGISIGKILPSLGMSFIIAVVIAVTVDLLTRKAFFDECRGMMHDITKSVYAAILRKSLPEPIFREVEDNIFKYPFLRQNLETSLCLEKNEKEKMYRGTVENCYWILNLTEREQKFPLGATINTDIKLPPEKLEKTGFYLIEVEDEEGNKIIEEKGDNIKQQKKLKVFSVRREIKLFPKAKNKIRFAYKNYYNYDDLYVAVTNAPTIDFIVRVYHPEDLDIEAWALHSGGEGRFTKERKHNKILECRLKGGILPYNGILLVWKSKSN